jgi:hypothetical protein
MKYHVCRVKNEPREGKPLDYSLYEELNTLPKGHRIISVVLDELYNCWVIIWRGKE